MRYKDLAENEVGLLDMDINSYVDQVIPMLLPLDATKAEKEKLRRILFQVTALNVYDIKIDGLFNQFIGLQDIPYKKVSTTELRKYSEPEIMELWYKLEKTNPKMAYRHKLLKRSQNSRYASLKIWKDNNPELSIHSSRRLVTEYTKRMWTKSTYKSAKDYEETPIQVQTIFALRDFFNYGGDLEEVDLNSKEFKRLESIVKSMRNDLARKMENIRFYEVNKMLRNPFIFSENSKILKDNAYFNACHLATEFSKRNRYLAYKISAEKSAIARQEKMLTTKEYKQLSKYVIDIFDKNFSRLPTNEAEHQQQLDILFKKMATMLSQNPEKKRTHTDDYVRLMRQTYNKYMEQLKNGKLPIRLSYFPEDKEIYAQIVSEAKEAQENEKKNGKDSDYDIGKAILYLGVIFPATMISIDGLRLNNPLPAMLEITSIASAYIISKVVEHRRLYMDVEKRLGIKNITISAAKASTEEKRNNPDEVLAGENKVDGISFEYKELPSTEREIPQTYVRRRRSERHNHNDSNEH